MQKKLTEEHVWLIATDTKLKPKGIFELSVGTVNASFISPRSIFMKLLLLDSAGFMIAHNHPSLDSTPSPEDIKVAQAINNASKIMDINFFDFVIIGETPLSFVKEGLL